MFVIYLIGLALSLLIVFVSFFLLVILVNIFFLFKTGVPYVTSGKEGYAELFDKAVSVSGVTVYDLGCGNGEFLFEAASRGAKKCVGYELSFFFFFIRICKVYFSGRGQGEYLLARFYESRFEPGQCHLSLPDTSSDKQGL